MNETVPTPAIVPAAAATPTLFSRPAALIGAGLGLAALGALATALVLGRPDSNDSPYMSTTEPALQSTKPKDTKDTRAAKPAVPAKDTQRAAAPACANCGVVEAVTAVRHEGEGSGLGAVAGGVLGGVVGHQIGGGNGKKAMTVLGAVGGGLAGNEIEKRQRATTSYQVQVRMADGSLRSVSQPQSLAVGQRVTVDGQRLTPVVAGSAAGSAPG
jgi:outer membrane lipoprotein SlyB